MLPTHEAILSFLSSLDIKVQNPQEATFKLEERFNVGFLWVKDESDDTKEMHPSSSLQKSLVMLLECPLRQSDVDFVMRLNEEVHFIKPEHFTHNIKMVSAINYDEENNPYLVLMIVLPEYATKEGIEALLFSALSFVKANLPQSFTA